MWRGAGWVGLGGVGGTGVVWGRVGLGRVELRGIGVKELRENKDLPGGPRRSLNYFLEQPDSAFVFASFSTGALFTSVGILEFSNLSFFCEHFFLYVCKTQNQPQPKLTR